MNEKTVLAIDPGSKKCGMALVRRPEEGPLEVLWRAIVPSLAIVPKLHEAYSNAPVGLIVVGSGTHSDQVVRAIREHLGSIGIIVIEEHDSTMQARERYWEHHKRKGWRRLLPATMQVPPVPVDDFAAVIIAERVLCASL